VDWEGIELAWRDDCAINNNTHNFYDDIWTDYVASVEWLKLLRLRRIKYTETVSVHICKLSYNIDAGADNIAVWEINDGCWRTN
jgi:hypothetical protein